MITNDMLDMLKAVDARLDIEAQEVGGNYILSATHGEIKELIAEADKLRGCPACTTGVMAGPIPGTLSNGERCDTCETYASDADAQTATEPGQPTPVPWRLVSGEVWRDDTRIAQMDREPGNGTDPAERDANAAFIVCACNCHDDLLAACKAAEFTVRNGGNTLDASLLTALNAAIAKVKPAC